MNILTFHTFAPGKVTDMFRRSVEDFENDLELVSPYVVSLEKLLETHDGTALTFDDATGSQLLYAVPRLLSAGLPATFYIPTGLVGGDSFLSWDQLRQLRDMGFSIQSHGHAHTRYSEMTIEQVTDDLAMSFFWLNKELGIKPQDVATPFGEYTRDIADVVRLGGFRSMRTTQPTQEYSDDFCLPSFAVKNDSDISAWLPVSATEYWDEIYSGKTRREPGGHEHLRFAEIKKYLKGPTVVDFGAGYAQLCKELKAEHGDWEVVASDVSSEAASSSGYRPYMVSSAYSTPATDKQFNTAVCSCTMEYMDDNAAFLREAARIAERLVVVVPNGKHSTCSQLREYTPETVPKLLGEYGQVTECYVKHGFVLAVVEFE